MSPIYSKRILCNARLRALRWHALCCLILGWSWECAPDRIYIIGKDGNIAIKGARGPRGFAPSVDDAGDWLADNIAVGDD